MSIISCTRWSSNWKNPSVLDEKDLASGKERRVHLVGDLRNQPVDGQWVVLHARPGRTRQRLGDALMQLGRAAILLDHALEGGDLEVAE
jgi:hypothetical protein